MKNIIEQMIEEAIDEASKKLAAGLILIPKDIRLISASFI